MLISVFQLSVFDLKYGKFSQAAGPDSGSAEFSAVRAYTPAKKRGVHLGRPAILEPAQIDHARTLIESGESPRAVARSLKVGRSTLYRALNLSTAKAG